VVQSNRWRKAIYFKSEKEILKNSRRMKNKRKE
jgi:hypothetical protein